MRVNKILIITTYLSIICTMTKLSSNQIIVDAKQISSLTQFSSQYRSTGVPWDKLTDKEKAGYYERILLNILGSYIQKEIKNFYGEDRQYWNGKILNIKPLMYAHEIKVQIETFIGAHNPPYGIEIITFLLEGGLIKVTDFHHYEE